MAAFRATLEEVLEADLLLHIRDISHPDTNAQKADVEQVLRGLFAVEHLEHPDDSVLEVCNKADLLQEEQRAALQAKGALMISAVTGEGVENLLARISHEMARRFFVLAELTLPVEDGRGIAWLHAHGKVMAQKIEGDYIHLQVQLSKENIRRFEQLRHAAAR